MADELSRAELVAIVERLMQGEDDDEETFRLLETLSRHALHPAVSDLIYWPEEDLTAEEIVERALAYRPIAL